MPITSLEAYCLIIRSNPDSNWQDAEGQSYQYGQTVPRYTRIQPGVRFVMDRREGGNVVLVGHGEFGTIEDDGVDKNGRRRYRAHFKEFIPFPEPYPLTSDLRAQISAQPGFNQQHSIREIPPKLHAELVALGGGQVTNNVLHQFCSELRTLRMDRSSGQPKLYKPLMIIAAARTLADAAGLSYGAPLLDHYRTFARAVGVDETHPEYPYYHLQSDGFWAVLDSEGQPIQRFRIPTNTVLRKTTVQLEPQRAACIWDPVQRRFVLQALLTHFTTEQSQALAGEWPELSGVSPQGGVTSVNATSEAIRMVHGYISARGFHFTLPQVAAFYCALRTKPFVILAGISGTGKTRLPRLFAETIGASLRLEAVRPDWADSADLIGYRDLKETFRPGRLLGFAGEATKSPARPHVFVLDEMNLARVEHYLADVLSKIESRRREDGKVVTDQLVAPEELNDDRLAAKWHEIGLPENLFIVGTVNMDETTYGFSRKVLDRAFTLEFSEVDLYQFGLNLEPDALPTGSVVGLELLKPLALTLSELTDEPHRETCIRVIDLLARVNRSLQKAQLQVGYRVRDEACLFVCHASTISDIFPENIALDYMLCAKVLPRIHGGAAVLQEIMLDLLELTLRNNSAEYRSLIAEVRSGDQQLSYLLRHTPGLDSFRYPQTAAKLRIMLERLNRDGYTSYWL